MLSGRHAFPGDNAYAILAAVLASAPTRLAIHCPSLAPAIALLVERAMAAEPEARFANGEEMRAAIAAARISREPEPPSIELPSIELPDAPRGKPAPLAHAPTVPGWDLPESLSLEPVRLDGTVDEPPKPAPPRPKKPPPRAQVISLPPPIIDLELAPTPKRAPAPPPVRPSLPPPRRASPVVPLLLVLAIVAAAAYFLRGYV
jgi:serine/threonine-protein kinase